MKKSTQYVRAWRLRNRVKYLYQNLKGHAKKRCIPFTLTLEYWVLFCDETHYPELVGRGAEDYTIDRKDHRKGYEDGNIQIMTNQKNAQKQHTDRCKTWYSLESGEPYNTLNPF